MLAAGAWGLAEATLFFLVPDVLITWLAVRRLRDGLWGSLAATLGALCGGLLMYGWGSQDAAGALAALDHVPAVNTEMLAEVRAQLEDTGLMSLFTGALTGKPYKIYAVQAASLGASLLPFLLISIPARLLRFLLLALLASGVRQRVIPAWPQRRVDTLLLKLWGAFYAVFFSLMPS